MISQLFVSTCKRALSKEGGTVAQERSPNQAIRLRLVWDFIDRHIGRELHDKIVAMIPLVTLNALLKREHPYLIRLT